MSDPSMGACEGLESRILENLIALWTANPEGKILAYLWYQPGSTHHASLLTWIFIHAFIIESRDASFFPPCRTRMLQWWTATWRVCRCKAWLCMVLMESKGLSRTQRTLQNLHRNLVEWVLCFIRSAGLCSFIFLVLCFLFHDLGEWEPPPQKKKKRKEKKRKYKCVMFSDVDGINALGLALSQKLFHQKSSKLTCDSIWDTTCSFY